MKKVLHVGCGNEHLPPYLSHCEEIRLDIDPAVKPDILGNMADLPEGIGPFDAVFSCHSLEHLMPYDVLPCLDGFRRVLKSGGVAIIIVPDLEGIEPTDEVVYRTCPDGLPVTGLDMFYGHSMQLRDHPYMAHHCGFVKTMLEKVLGEAGFKNVVVHRQANEFIYRSLVGIGEKP